MLVAQEGRGYPWIHGYHGPKAWIRFHIDHFPAGDGGLPRSRDAANPRLLRAIYPVPGIVAILSSGVASVFIWEASDS